MYDENLHIIPEPEKGYPEPDITADDAWKDMAELLDASMPAPPSETPQAPPESPPPSAGTGFLGISPKTWFFGLGALAVISVITWVILNLNGRPITLEARKENRTELPGIIARDSLTETSQDNNMPIKVIEKSDAVDAQKPENQATGSWHTDEKITNQKTSQQQLTKAKDETPLPKKVTPESRQQEVIPAQPQLEPSNDVTATERIHEMQDQQKEVAGKEENIFQITDNQPNIVSPTTDSAEQSEKQTREDNPPDKKAAGEARNITWQIGAMGNIGEVVQKGRDPNMFYGGMLIGGLWHKRLEGGIETGAGWEEYRDYGTVTELIRRTDSIPLDTLGNYQVIQTDTARTYEYTYRYQYLQVPLFITKQLLSAGKFSLEFKTGPLAGFIIKKHEFINEPGPVEGEVINTDRQNYTRQDISWQWHIILPLRWNFNDRLSLSISPFGVFYLNNLYDSRNQPPHTPFGIGVYGGLIYRFK